MLVKEAQAAFNQGYINFYVLVVEPFRIEHHLAKFEYGFPSMLNPVVVFYPWVRIGGPFSVVFES
jgi:hypothetical protein